MKTVIIGGLAAGMSAACKLKRIDKGHKVLVVEKGLEAAYAACGLPYYISGANSDRGLLLCKRPEELEQAGIKLMLGHEAVGADFVRKEMRIMNSSSGFVFPESYDNLLIACGSVCVTPHWFDPGLRNVFCIKTLEDSELIKRAVVDEVRRVVVVGGGYIGLEMAEAFLRLKRRVTLIEREERLLTGFDREFSRKVFEHLSKHGVKVRLGETVLKLEGGSAVSAVISDMGAYKADLVIVATGMRPNTDFLAGSGVKRLENGAIVTDDRMRTSEPCVWAAGDCATVWNRVLGKNVHMPLATNAVKQGRHVAENIMGRTRRYLNALGTVMLKVVELELGKTGVGEEEAAANGMDCASVTVAGVDCAPYYPNQGPMTAKMIFRPHDGALLGAQIIGKQGAALRANVLAACITAGMTVKEIGELDLGCSPPYSQPCDILHLTAGAAETKRLEIKRNQE